MRTVALLLAYAAALAFGTYQTFRPALDSRFAVSQTERGDGMLNHLLLENSWLALTDPGYRGALATPPFFFPEPYTLMYSENMFGSAPIYWALRLVTDYQPAYMWWQIVSCGLNFVAFAVVCRWLRLPHSVAVLGAFLGAFAAVHADQIKHSQMIARFYSPFAVYYAIRLATEAEGKAKALNRMLGALFLQCLACVYTGWFLATGLAVFLPLLVGLRPGAAGGLWRFARENRRRVAGVLVLWAGPFAALFVPYLLVNRGMSRDYEESFGLFPTAAAWLTGPPGSRWSETLDAVRTPAPFEGRLFSGFALYGLMLVAAVRLALAERKDRFPLWPAAAAWAVLTAATDQHGESLWRAVRHLPGGGAIRLVSRVYVTVYLFGTLGSLLWLSAALERMPRGWARAAILAPLAAALVWEQTGLDQDSFHRSDFYDVVERHAETLRGAEVGYVVPRYVDTQGDVKVGPYGEVFAMWVGLRANVPVVNGYSGRWPNGYPQPHPPGGLLEADHIRGWLSGRFKGRVRLIDSERPGESDEIVIE